MDDGTGGGENPSSDEVDEIQRAWLRERPGTPVSSIGVITRIWHIAKLLEDDRRATMLELGMDASTRNLLSTLRRSGRRTGSARANSRNAAGSAPARSRSRPPAPNATATSAGSSPLRTVAGCTSS